jgi:citrate synthase
MSYEKEYVRGLRDVAACQTGISFVDPLGALYYAGYDLDRLLERVCYEEVIYLLLNKKLPNQNELDELKTTLTTEMKLPKQIIDSIKGAPKNSHPMEILRTETSHLSLYDPDPFDKSDLANKKRALGLIAKVPTLVTTIYRVRSQQELVQPKKEF